MATRYSDAYEMRSRQEHELSSLVTEPEEELTSQRHRRGLIKEWFKSLQMTISKQTERTKDSMPNIALYPEPWLSLVAVFGMNVLIGGSEFSFTLMYDEVMDRYDISRGSAGAAETLRMAFAVVSVFVCAPVLTNYGYRLWAVTGAILTCVGLLVSAFSPNTVCFDIFYGIFGGIGEGCRYLITYILIQEEFSAHRQLATGISLLGITVGNLMAPFLVPFLLDSYSFDGTFLVLAAIYAHNIVFGLMLTPKHHLTTSRSRQIDLTRDMNTKSKTLAGGCRGLSDYLCDTSIYDNSKYIMYMFVRMASYNSKMILIINLANAADIGDRTLKDPQYIIVVMAVSNLVSRALATLAVSLRPAWQEAIYLLGLLCILGASITASMQFFITAAIMTGSSDGLYETMHPLLVLRLVGVEGYPYGFSVVETTRIVATISAGSISGLLVDISGDYFLVFIFSGCSAILAIVLMVAIIVKLCHETWTTSGSTSERNGYEELDS